MTESHIPLNVRALGKLLIARFHRELMQTYQSDMLYLLAKRSYDGIESPEEFRDRLTKKPKKEPTAREIVAHILNRLTGR